MVPQSGTAQPKWVSVEPGGRKDQAFPPGVWTFAGAARLGLRRLDAAFAQSGGDLRGGESQRSKARLIRMGRCTTLRVTGELARWRVKPAAVQGAGLRPAHTERLSLSGKRAPKGEKEEKKGGSARSLWKGGAFPQVRAAEPPRSRPVLPSQKLLSTLYGEVAFGGGFVDGKIAWARRFPGTKGKGDSKP